MCSFKGAPQLVSLRGQHEYLRSVEDMHSETVHSRDVPLVTVHFVRLGGFCDVLLLRCRPVRMHYVKGDLEVKTQGEVNCWVLHSSLRLF